MRELTLRSLLIGAAITVVFTAANVYLGLRVGMTFASSIPAAVISMAVLRLLKNGDIRENNIVQTVASAAGTLSSVIFVLPGLLMIGWWKDVPFWPTFTACAAGGVLGVLYTIPLRRAMVVDSDLPYPEGVAAAEVLLVGMGSRADAEEASAENRAGLRILSGSALASAAFAALAAARVFASDIATYVRLGPAATGVNFSFSLALMGAGHLVGISAGLAIFIGFLFAWGAAVPWLTVLHPSPLVSASVLALDVWRHQVRFIGAGAIAISSVWTLGKLMRPLCAGVLSTLAAARHRDLIPHVERDMPLWAIALTGAACLPPIVTALVVFLNGGVPASFVFPLVCGTVLYILVMGFLVAAACGYMAGLFGSSNSPVSGLAILTVIGIALPLAAVANGGHVSLQPLLIAYTLFVCSIVLCVATIANDNLQDLKTGLLVGATPWKQQTALIVGVLMGAAAIPPILQVLNRAYGFTGGAHALPAPQATLISTLAAGVIAGKLSWKLMGIGVAVGIAAIAIDEILGVTHRLRLPPLAVGLGIYLPPSTTLPIALGALLGLLYRRFTSGCENPERAARFGILAASGLIVGESIFGVLLAGLIVASNSPTPLALAGESFAPFANVLGAAAFIACMAGLYGWVARAARR